MLDPSPFFRDFVKEKLSIVKIAVDAVQGRRDASTKLLSLLPDLVIIDVDKDFSSTLEFLERKRSNPNTTAIPVIVIGPSVSSEKIIGLIRLGVTKYFARPFMVDVLIKTMETLFTIPIDLDPTPCIIEAHKNKNIIVVEVSKGLNLDKIAILRFHLADLISNHAITEPKLLLIFYNLDLNFVDGINLEKLFDSIIYSPRVTKKEIKVLTQDPFIKQFVDGHAEYSGIQVEDTLDSLLNSLVESAASSSLSELVASKLLAVDKNTIACYTDMVFKAELELRKQEINLNQK